MTLGMSYNGYEFHKKFATLCDSRPLPTFRLSSTEIEGRDGEQFDGLTYGPRTFAITLVAQTKSQVELHLMARELMGVLAVREPKQFRFYDEKVKDGSNEVQLYRLAVPDGDMDVEEFVRAGRWTIRFKQVDPYLYGKKRDLVVSAGNWSSVNMGGNAEVYPTATSSASSGNYRIDYKVGGSGYHVLFNGVGNGVTVNFEKQRVVSSGADGKGLQVGSRFMPFKGTVQVKASHKTTLSWQERWL